MCRLSLISVQVHLSEEIPKEFNALRKAYIGPCTQVTQVCSLLHLVSVQQVVGRPLYFLLLCF